MPPTNQRRKKKNIRLQGHYQKKSGNHGTIIFPWEEVYTNEFSMVQTLELQLEKYESFVERYRKHSRTTKKYLAAYKRYVLELIQMIYKMDPSIYELVEDLPLPDERHRKCGALPNLIMVNPGPSGSGSRGHSSRMHFSS